MAGVRQRRAHHSKSDYRSEHHLFRLRVSAPVHGRQWPPLTLPDSSRTLLIGQAREWLASAGIDRDETARTSLPEGPARLLQTSPGTLASPLGRRNEIRLRISG